MLRINPGRFPAIRFNIMVVGPTGSGKTTFLMTLFKRYVDDVNAIITYNSMDFNNRTTKTVRMERIGAFKLHSEAVDCEISLYDSVGFGDSINNDEAINYVRDYLARAHEEWLSFNGNCVKEKDRNKKDNRVHCLFYFIAPHRVKDIDAEFLKQLSGLAPIVPVIAKADIMTVVERAVHLLNVQDCINRIRKDLGTDKSINFLFESEKDFQDSIALRNLQLLSLEGNISSNVPETVDVIGEAITEESLEGQLESEAEKEAATSESNDSTNSTNLKDGHDYDMLDSQYNHSIAIAVDPSYNIDGDNETTEARVQQPVEPKPDISLLPRLPNIYAVICDYSKGLREYPWGDLHIDCERHSDFRRLQRLVLEENNISKLRSECQLLSMKYKEDNAKLLTNSNSKKEIIDVAIVVKGTMAVINSYFILFGWIAFLLFLIGFFVSRGDFNLLYQHCNTLLTYITMMGKYLPVPVTAAIIASVFTVALSSNTKYSHNDVLLWFGKLYENNMKCTY